MNYPFTLIASLTMLSTGLAWADVKPNNLFSEGVVLQQGSPLPVWGTADDGEVVTVKFQDQTVNTTARDGRWALRLQPAKAGGPFVLTIAGKNTITLTNVLVGEVWLCSGQSNMEMPLARAATGSNAIAAASDPLLHAFAVPFGTSDEPRTNVSGSWKVSSPETAKYFSAVGYFFGRDLRKARNVPVGLIFSYVGGTPAEAWTPHATLEADPVLAKILDRHAETVKKYDPIKAQADHDAIVAKAKAEGRDPAKVPPLRSPSESPNRPSGLYNGMIAPLEPFAIKGVIWYQGESNNGRGKEYQTLFPAMIGSWRDIWGEGQFPFLFVQIAPHKDMTPELREAQLLSWQKVPRTAMAVITDVGEQNDIHPTRKEPVGQRLALAARSIAYGEKIEYSGPVYKSIKIKGNRAIVSFTHIGGGLVAKDGNLKGFSIAGKDGHFIDATAEIKGKNVIVSNPSVDAPVNVRYGWANTPDVNLFNQEGLPATPFRTDVN